MQGTIPWQGPAGTEGLCPLGLQSLAAGWLHAPGISGLIRGQCWSRSHACKFLGHLVRLKACPETVKYLTTYAMAWNIPEVRSMWTVQMWPPCPALCDCHLRAPLRGRAVKGCLAVSNHGENKAVEKLCWILKAALSVACLISVFSSWIVMNSKFMRVEAL